MLYSCAPLYNLLKPVAILCKAIQEDEVSIFGALEATSRSIEMLSTILTLTCNSLQSHAGG